MTDIKLKGNTIHTSGSLPAVGNAAPKLKLTKIDLTDVSLDDFPGKKVLNIFPSVDTAICATSVRTFNSKLSGRGDVAVLNISADLPFAMKRFCGAEGLERVHALSSFRSTFAKDFGLQIVDGPMAGLCSRCIVVLDGQNRVLYTEQVPEIAQEPNYDAAIKALG
ncbi:MAG: thiol peroxidase [Myxococcota bacterium]